MARRQQPAAPRPSSLDAKLSRVLARRREVGTLRSLALVDVSAALDFSSNDYLGFARSAELRTHVAERKRELATTHGLDQLALGATGSRLISGNSVLAMDVEQQLAGFYGAEAALVFSSGYAANVGVLSSLPQRGDFVLFDELVHNSCHEGLRLSRAAAAGRTAAFRHNDLADLRRRLEEIRYRNSDVSGGDEGDVAATVFVVVESLYSMDGDVAPLADMAQLCEQLGAELVVDEAHGTGVYGPQGSGVVRALRLETSPAMAVRVYTFGKAMGCHGAVVCGSQVLVDYLVNYARSFIYTTAPPFDQLATMLAVHEFCGRQGGDEARELLFRRIRYFQQAVRRHAAIPRSALLESDSPIQGVVFAGNHAVLAAARAMRGQGVVVVPIRSPTVAKGAERFRVVIHAHNTQQEIDRLVAALAAVFERQQQQQQQQPVHAKL